MIEISDLGFKYSNAGEPTLNALNMTIESGSFTAIVGGNGSGKSTLCKILCGLVPRHFPGILSGSVRVNGLVPANTPLPLLSRKIGYVFQDYENQLVCPTVLQEAAFMPLNFGLHDYLDRANHILNLLDLQPIKHTSVNNLSGGQKHLVALASILSMNPDILIVDEPSSQLDTRHSQMIYSYLKRLNREQRKTVIVLEHDPHLIADYCEEVICLHNGSIAWSKPTKEALSDVQALERAWVSASQITLAASKVAQAHPSGFTLPITLEDGIKWFSQMTPSLGKTFPNKPSSPLPPAICEVRDLAYTYKHSREKSPVISGMSFTLYQGQHVAVLGANGTGKTTLLKLLSGIYKSTPGSIRINNTPIHQLDGDLFRYAAYVNQSPELMFIQDTIRADVAYALKERKISGWQQKTEQLLEAFNLSALANRDGRTLSGGEQRRASIAVAMALNPLMVLLDEPTYSLDLLGRQMVQKLLEQFNGTTVIYATHDMDLAARADRVLVLHGKGILYDGGFDELWSNDAVLEHTGLIPPQLAKISRLLNMEPPVSRVEHFAERFREVS